MISTAFNMSKRVEEEKFSFIKFSRKLLPKRIVQFDEKNSVKKRSDKFPGIYISFLHNRNIARLENMRNAGK